MEVDGYLAVTYISSSGVRLRRWADFDADNVVGAVYVGDKVQVKARVQTEKGASAYITEDGLYITSDAQYFDDYTTVLKDAGKDGQKTGSGTGDRKDAGDTDSVSDRKDAGRTGGTTQSDDSTQTENSGGWDFSDPELNRQE